MRSRSPLSRFSRANRSKRQRGKDDRAQPALRDRVADFERELAQLHDTVSSSDSVREQLDATVVDAEADVRELTARLHETEHRIDAEVQSRQSRPPERPVEANGAPRRGRAIARRLIAALPWAALALVVGAVAGAAAAVQPALALVAAIALPSVVFLFLRPEWLPAALVLTLFIEGTSVGGVQISRLAAPVAAVIVLARLVAGGRLAPLPSKRVLVAVGAYGVWALASGLWTLHPGTVSQPYSGTAFALSSLSLSVVYMLAFAALIEKPEDVRRVSGAIWISSTAAAVVGVSEYLSTGGRSLGFIGDANFFAALQVSAMPIGVGFAASLRGRSAVRLLVLLGVGVVACSVLTSLSRGGILALAGVGTLLLLQPSRTLFRTRAVKRACLLALATAGVALLGLAYRELVQDLASRSLPIITQGEAGSGRAYLWRAAITGWKEHPVLGLGYGAFAPESPTLLRRTPGVDLDAYRIRPEGTLAHNAYLGSLVELGVVGLLLFVSLLAAAYSTLRRVVRRADAQGAAFAAVMARSLKLSLIGFALTSMFLSTETDRTLWMLLGITLALPRFVTATSRESSRAGVEELPPLGLPSGAVPV